MQESGNLSVRFADPAANAPIHGAVTRASEHWGLISTGQFSRSFRESFGFAPGTAVGAWVDRRNRVNTKSYGNEALQDGVRGDPASLEHC